MSSVLITGGLGFVGGRLSKKLTSKFDVIVSSRKHAEESILAAHGKVKQVDHSGLLSKETFPKNIDTVIHLAALNEWDCVSLPSEAIRVNIDETRIILENAIAAGVKQFIYFSTAHIYGSPLQGAIDEDTLPVPIHPYAITHKAAEDYVVAATLQKKVHGIVIRLSNSFGDPVIPTVNRWTLLANDLAKQAVEQHKLVLRSNGCQYRDFVALTDVENAVFHMVDGELSRFNKIIYNLGAGRSLRVIDMAGMIASVYKELSGRTIDIQLPENSMPTHEPDLLFSIKRLTDGGMLIKNDWDAELRRLLVFCDQHFSSRPVKASGV